MTLRKLNEAGPGKAFKKLLHQRYLDFSILHQGSCIVERSRTTHFPKKILHIRKKNGREKTTLILGAASRNLISAKRASGTVLEPRIYAINMEAVVASGKAPEPLAIFSFIKTHTTIG